MFMLMGGKFPRLELLPHNPSANLDWITCFKKLYLQSFLN